MKKILALLLALSMLFALTACGRKDKNTPTGESTGATTSTTESTNDVTNSTENTTQDVTESTTGGETTTPPATTPPTTTPPATTPPATTPPTTTPPTTTPPTASHTHSYSDKITTAATCDKEGVKTFTCSCGHAYTEKIPAIGQHTWSRYAVYTRSTATSVGEARRNCQTCTAYESKEIPKLEDKEWSVDNTINITGTAYEAFVRDYTHFYAEENLESDYYGVTIKVPRFGEDKWYQDLYNFFPTNTLIARISILQRDGLGLAQTAMESTLSTDAYNWEELFKDMLAIVRANFTIGDPTFTGITGTSQKWNSIDEIPFKDIETVRMKAPVLGKDGTQLFGEDGTPVTCTLSCSRRSNDYHVYFSLSLLTVQGF